MFELLSGDGFAPTIYASTSAYVCIGFMLFLPIVLSVSDIWMKKDGGLGWIGWVVSRKVRINSSIEQHMC